MTTAILQSQISSQPLIARGKVRDLYAVGDAHMLMVATDRISAFDVVFPNGMPGKGKLLTEMSKFWFAFLADIVPNHLADLSLETVLPDPQEYAQAAQRSMLVQRLTPLPIEAVVRGYLAGSGWEDYQRDGAVCGVALPKGLQQAGKLSEPIFTAAHKAAVGEHDENIDFATVVDKIGLERAQEVRAVSVRLYQRAANYAAARGIIIADTKFEFGLDQQQRLVLMDEVLTPDSSRFWDAATWSEGQSPASFDKQFLRDWLKTQNWDYNPPAPTLPDVVIAQTMARYQQALQQLTA